MSPKKRIQEHLQFLYGAEIAVNLWADLHKSINQFKSRNPRLRDKNLHLSQEDAILITYGDQFQESHRLPLDTLNDFLTTHIKGAINGVHILPFYPYSSDDGFSVIDYRQVDPALGNWQSIAQLTDNFRLMFDAVINHISRQSEWFQGYLEGRKPFTAYFITVPPETDLSMVVRPRALPLLTPVETASGRKYVWTTFSDDQIDLNYANPRVLLEIIDILLYYIERGAEIIRLDAIAYLWKEIGTTCIHLPQTHHVVKLFRAILDEVAPGVILITETNVPHEENISYFGSPLRDEDGRLTDQGDEAQMVYQFPLGPLVLHTFYAGDAQVLTEWAAALKTPYPMATFFNFIASHDGIGVRPAEGLIAPQEIQNLVDRTLAHGGQVSYKTNPDGSQSAYELNITLYDALNNPANPNLEIDVRRFLASQVIMISLAGVPGIYVHSLFGSRNCYDCVEQSGRARSINREKFQKRELQATLANPNSRASRVFSGYTQLLKIRRNHPAFHPFAAQRVLTLDPHLFALLRTDQSGDEQILCLINVSSQTRKLSIPFSIFNLPPSTYWRDLVSGEDHPADDSCLELELEPYQYLWLLPD